MDSKNTNIILKIENLSKIYKNKNIEFKALSNVSFNIYEKEIISLLGVNGAGKTTLSSIIATLHPASSGDIFYQNQSIYSNLIEYRKILGYCPQKPNLDEMLTLKENLYFAGKFYNLNDNEVESKIKELTLKLNLEKYLDQYSNILSGGYQQRFMIARTLMHNPKLIILDEPTVGLDPDVRRNLWDIILELKNLGMSILLTTHYLDEAEYLSDRLIILDQGEIKIIDTTENLKNSYKKENLEEVFLSFLKKSLPAA